MPAGAESLTFVCNMMIILWSFCEIENHANPCKIKVDQCPHCATERSHSFRLIVVPEAQAFPANSESWKAAVKKAEEIGWMTKLKSCLCSSHSPHMPLALAIHQLTGHSCASPCVLVWRLVAHNTTLNPELMQAKLDMDCWMYILNKSRRRP